MEPTNRARHLRNDPTDAEAKLWQALSARKVGGRPLQPAGSH
ncbi:DUF559 domain-containing protein [Sphingomonas sp.]